MPLARAPPKRDPPERERVIKLISEVKNISVSEEQYREEDNYHHHQQHHTVSNFRGGEGGRLNTNSVRLFALDSGSI